MTKKDLVKAALKFEDRSIVPYEIKLTIQAARKLESYLNESDIENKLGNFVAKVFPEPPGAWTEIKPGYMRDQFGVVWNRTIDKDIGVVEEYILKEPTTENLFVPAKTELNFAHYPGFIAKHKGLYLLSGIRFSLFERAWTLRGMENLLADMIENPDFVSDLFAKLTDYNIYLIEQAAKFDIDGIHFGDDWGQQHGLIMGPKLWRKFIKPCLERMYSRSHELGLDVWIHSCGDIIEILPELIEIGLNVFNPFQPEVMDIYQVKRRFGSQISFNGGLSIQRVLPFGTPDEVRQEVRKLIKEIGRGGGYVLGPSHRVPGDVPVENMLALINEVKAQKGMEAII